MTAYAVVTENDSGQYYADYAYNHPLFTQGMEICSNEAGVKFLNKEINDGQIADFLREWNASRSPQGQVYIAYDSPGENSQSASEEAPEYMDPGFPAFRCAAGYDAETWEPLFYDRQPAGAAENSQLRRTAEKAKEYGYEKAGFLLDESHLSEQSARHLDSCGYHFVIPVKATAELAAPLVLENKESFELSRVNRMDRGITGMTTARRLYESDVRERYIHIYNDIDRKSAELLWFEDTLQSMENYMNQSKNQEISFGPAYTKYFALCYDREGKIFRQQEERTTEMHKAIQLFGYYAVVTSEKMTAKEAFHIYKYHRDLPENIFRGDKLYFGDAGGRTFEGESVSAKVFIGFLAMIIRNRIYACLNDGKRQMNWMTVPAALKELEKIELTRQPNNTYRLDCGVTDTQKELLAALGLTEKDVERTAARISEELKAAGMNT